MHIGYVRVYIGCRCVSLWLCVWLCIGYECEIIGCVRLYVVCVGCEYVGYM